MTDILFAIGVSTLGVFIGANFALIFARFKHNDALAKMITHAFSKVIWLFKLGGDDSAHSSGSNGPLRA